MARDYLEWYMLLTALASQSHARCDAHTRWSDPRLNVFECFFLLLIYYSELDRKGEEEQFDKAYYMVVTLRHVAWYISRNRWHKSIRYQ